MINRKVLSSVLIAFAIASCAKNDSVSDIDDSLPDMDTDNRNPSIPQLIYPTDNQLCVDNQIEFNWNPSEDDDGDAVSYTIEVSKDKQFSTIDETAYLDETDQTFILDKGTAYYWRVRAVDSKKALSAYSRTFSLYTEREADSNYLPFAPNLVSPVQEIIKTTGTVELGWQATDVDNNPMVFDIYFGTENPPIKKIAEDYENSTLSMSVAPTTDYFWKVVVKDDQGGQTLGTVWHFSTE